MAETPDSASVAPLPVAHRGAAERFPENTVCALEAAVRCGLRFVEVDVQLTADRVPVLLHDASLLRTGGRDVLASATVAAELCAMPAGEPDRFGAQFAGTTVPSLTEALAVLAGTSISVFVEIKRHSLRAFGRQRVLDAVVPVLQSGADVVVISFDRPVLEEARARGVARIGWVLGGCDDATLRAAAELQPDFLFCNQKRLPAGSARLPTGTWDWVIYEVTDIANAMQLAARGVRYVESMAACRLRRELER